MSRPGKIKNIERVLNDWTDRGEFSAGQFANQYNNIYTNYSMSNTGFYQYFVELERKGKLKIIRSETWRNNKYQKVFDDENRNK